MAIFDDLIKGFKDDPAYHLLPSPKNPRVMRWQRRPTQEPDPGPEDGGPEQGLFETLHQMIGWLRAQGSFKPEIADTVGRDLWTMMNKANPDADPAAVLRAYSEAMEALGRDKVGERAALLAALIGQRGSGAVSATLKAYEDADAYVFEGNQEVTELLRHDGGALMDVPLDEKREWIPDEFTLDMVRALIRDPGAADEVDQRFDALRADLVERGAPERVIAYADLLRRLVVLNGEARRRTALHSLMMQQGDDYGAIPPVERWELPEPDEVDEALAYESVLAHGLPKPLQNIVDTTTRRATFERAEADLVEGVARRIREEFKRAADREGVNAPGDEVMTPRRGLRRLKWPIEVALGHGRNVIPGVPLSWVRASREGNQGVLGHWGVARAHNPIARAVNLASGRDFMWTPEGGVAPFDDTDEERLMARNLVRFARSRLALEYEQDKAAGHRRYPIAYRGMGVPRSVVDQIQAQMKRGIRPVLPLLGATAFTPDHRIGAYYSGSQWTKENSKPGSVPMVIEVDRGDPGSTFDRSLAAWHPYHGGDQSEDLPPAYEFLSGLPYLMVEGIDPPDGRSGAWRVRARAPTQEELGIVDPHEGKPIGRPVSRKPMDAVDRARLAAMIGEVQEATRAPGRLKRVGGSAAKPGTIRPGRARAVVRRMNKARVIKHAPGLALVPSKRNPSVRRWVRTTPDRDAVGSNAPAKVQSMIGQWGGTVPGSLSARGLARMAADRSRPVERFAESLAPLAPDGHPDPAPWGLDMAQRLRSAFAPGFYGSRRLVVRASPQEPEEDAWEPPESRDELEDDLSERPGLEERRTYLTSLGGKRMEKVPEPMEVWKVDLDGDPHYLDIRSAEKWVTVYDDPLDLIDEADLYELYGDAEEAFNEAFWRFPEPLYHSTQAENVAAILEGGLQARSETRGFDNRGIPPAVFTSRNPEWTAVADYGPAAFEIDTAAMKADGYTPWVMMESPLVEQEQREALAHALGGWELVDRVRERADEAARGGYHADTVVILDDVPAKYLTPVD